MRNSNICVWLSPRSEKRVMDYAKRGLLRQTAREPFSALPLLKAFRKKK